MRLLFIVAPIAMFAQLCEVEEYGSGNGVITVHNADSETHEIVVADDPKCFAGLRTEIGSNTTRQFSVKEGEVGSYMCVGGGGGVKVMDGGNYEVRGGALGPR